MSHGSDFKSLIWGAVLLLLAACVPLVANGYWMSIALTIAMFTVLATSWSLFSGPTHYISLATAAFFGVPAGANLRDLRGIVGAVGRESGGATAALRPRQPSPLRRRTAFHSGVT